MLRLRTAEPVRGAPERRQGHLRPEAGEAVIFFAGCIAVIAITYIAAVAATDLAWRLNRRGRKGWL